MTKQILKMNNRRKHPVRRLPFWGDKEGLRFKSFWVVPETGGYGGGCKTGEALACVYIKHIKEHGSFGGLLQHIVLGMAGMEDIRGGDALKGQIVGFFTTIEGFLNTANKHINYKVFDIDYKELLKQANDGLNHIEPVFEDEE